MDRKMLLSSASIRKPWSQKSVATRMLGILLTFTSLSFTLSLLLLSAQTFSLAASASPSTSANNNNGSSSSNTSSQTLASKTGESKSIAKSISLSNKTSGSGEQQNAVEQQQLQSTDLSSMYVQIPIAESGETGVPDGVQQTLSGEPDSSGGSSSQAGGPNKAQATTWTGPWPKKFQIGYIKQSDLHQVLIESLKGDPFASLGSPQTTRAAPSTIPAPTPAPTIATGLKSAQPNQPTKSVPSESPLLIASQKSAQWPSSNNYADQQLARAVQQQQGKSLFIQQRPPIPFPPQSMQSANFRDLKLVQPFHQAQRYQQLNSLNQHQQRLPFNQQTLPKMLPTIAGYQQQQHQQNHLQPQFQFANFNSNMFKNQPMYTINNYQHQEQLQDANPMQIKVTQQANQFLGPPQAYRPQKSAEYYTSWRPVTSEKEQQAMTGKQAGNQQVIGQQATGTGDFQSLNDGFDDGFNSPISKTDSPISSSVGSTMNRHPALNNYLGSGGQDLGKLSPAMIGANMKQQLDSPTGSTKSTLEQTQKTARGATKGGSTDLGATKGGQTKGVQEAATKSRKASSGTPTTTQATTTTMTPSSTSPTTDTTQTTTPMTPTSAAEGTSTQSTTTTTTGSSVTTTVESETSEPDSESIDGDSETSTTTESASSASTTTMAPTASGSGTDSRSSSTSTASSLDASNQQDDSEVVTQGSAGQQSVGSANLPETTQTSTQKAEGSMREETTPSSTVQQSSSTTASAAVSSSTSTMAADSSGGSGEVEGDSVAKGKLDSMSDEALLAAAVRTGSEIGKTAANTQTMNLQRQRSSPSSNSSSPSSSNVSSSSKKTRSSERLVVQAGGRKSAPTKSSPSGASKRQTGSRSAKQHGSETATVKGSSSAKPLSSSRVEQGASKSSALKRKKSAAKVAKVAPSKLKATRMAQLQQAKPQVVSMSAAQAQSTAQTLASLLLSRCMASANCAQLLDVCSTKQATTTLVSGSGSQSEQADQAASNQSSNLGNAWSMPVGLMSSNMMSLAQALQADKVLRLFPQWKDTIENIVDQDTQSGYTLILPSNDAIDRLPSSTIDHWLSNSDLMMQIIDTHVLDSVEQIEVGKSPRSRFIRSKGLQVNEHRDKMVTINGKRLVYVNQVAPAGGRIHVIDGILDWPSAFGAASAGLSQPAKLLDIMDTLKQCDKFDGFVTLAEGTGLTQILMQDGPMTVFVPSNEALRKIPDEELEVIKNNSTALKEFLMYHVVNGSYFSQDLRDGQQLSSILDMKPIQVGVRVDGCSRRLVEANTSPMRRADIVAKNGVIHILDWYLTVRDNEWCDPIARSNVASSSGNNSATSSNSVSPSTSSSSSTNSERLQQLGTETGLAYATRVALPANHKLAIAGSGSVASQSNEQSVVTHKHDDLETRNIIVSATPIGSVNGDISSIDQIYRDLSA